jgi:hypothetical protein
MLQFNAKDSFKMYFEFHKDPNSPTNKIVVSITGIDVDEIGNGYSAEEIRKIAEGLREVADDLDRKNAELNTPEMQYPSGKP